MGAQTQGSLFHQDFQIPRSGSRKQGAADFEVFRYISDKNTLSGVDIAYQRIKYRESEGIISLKSMVNIVKIWFPNHRHVNNFLCLNLMIMNEKLKYFTKF